MKKLILISMSALAFRPLGFSTANTLTDDVADVNKRLDELEQQKQADADRIAELEKQLALKKTDPVPADSTLAMLCRGAGVEIDDVRWRIQAGVDPEQAVEAALAQKQFRETQGAKSGAATIVVLLIALFALVSFAPGAQAAPTAMAPAVVQTDVQHGAADAALMQ